MTLLEVNLTNLRCIQEARLELASGFTLIWGANGSGKTSLLEGMFLLGRGRSFRTRNTERLLRHGQDHLRVIGRISAGSEGNRLVGVELTREGMTARISGRPAASLAELSQAFPVQVIEPGVHRLIEEGGRIRRRWMDWAVFHVEPHFVDYWSRYSRALKQRNAALKSDPPEAYIWDGELARLGEAIDESRRHYLEQLDPYWQDCVAALSGLPVELHYRRGWSQEHSLREALRASHARDQARHLTHAGPHRADVAVWLRGRPARELLSRGQQKLVAVAMTLAQLRFLQASTETTPTLLLDDPAAELDEGHLGRFIEQISRLKSQLVMTSLHAESPLFGSPGRTFHIEHGRVESV